MPSNVSLPVPSTTIPVAGFKDVYDTAAVDKALQDLPQSASKAQSQYAANASPPPRQRKNDFYPKLSATGNRFCIGN